MLISSLRSCTYLVYTLKSVSMTRSETCIRVVGSIAWLAWNMAIVRAVFCLGSFVSGLWIDNVRSVTLIRRESKLESIHRLHWVLSSVGLCSISNTD